MPNASVKVRSLATNVLRETVSDSAGAYVVPSLQPGARAYEFKYWMLAGLPMMFVDGFFLLLTYVDILILQMFVGPAALERGLFKSSAW